MFVSSTDLPFAPISNVRPTAKPAKAPDEVSAFSIIESFRVSSDRYASALQRHNRHSIEVSSTSGMSSAVSRAISIGNSNLNKCSAIDKEGLYLLTGKSRPSRKAQQRCEFSSDVVNLRILRRDREYTLMYIGVADHRWSVDA